MAERQRPKTRRRGRPEKSAPEAIDVIRQAALAAFARNGFQGTSVAAIAAAANVAKPLVHYHFASKDALWQAAVGENLEGLRAEIVAFREELAKSSPEIAIDLVGRKLVQFAAGHPYLVRIVVDETGAGGARAEWLIETYLLPMYRLATQTLAEIGAAIPPGRQQPRPEHIVPILLGAMNFAFLDAEAIRRAYGADVWSDAYIERHGQAVAQILKSLFMG